MPSWQGPSRWSLVRRYVQSSWQGQYPYFRLCTIASLAPCFKSDTSSIYADLWCGRLLVNMCKLCYWEDNGGWFIPIMSVCLPFHEDDVAGTSASSYLYQPWHRWNCLQNWWGGILTPCCQAWICSQSGILTKHLDTKDSKVSNWGRLTEDFLYRVILWEKMLEGHLLRMIVNMASPHRSLIKLWVCHDLFLMPKSHSVTSPSPQSGLLFWPHFRNPSSFMEWLQSHPTRSQTSPHSHPKPRPKPQLEQTSHKLQGCQQPSNITWPSHDDCATMCYLHHLVGRPPSRRPGTWEFQTLFLFNLFLSYGMLMLFLLLRSCLMHLYAHSWLRAWLYAPLYPVLIPTSFHPHVDSRHSYRCLPDSIPIAYLCLWPCGSIPYK